MMLFHNQSASWLNLSEGARRAIAKLVKRGPTQQEAQAQKVARQAWIKTHPEILPEARLAVMPAYLRPCVKEVTPINRAA